MTAPRLLIVEDSQRDLDLILHEFQRSGFTPSFERVETAQAMYAALTAGPWDAIISDNALPAFNAREAMAVLQKSLLDIPFIIVSGVIGEERAVELMKAGASDYVSKQNLSRMVLVVERAIRDAAERRDRRRMELQLSIMNADRERMFNQRSALLDINNAVLANLDRRSLCQAIFDAVRRPLPCNGVLLTLADPESGALETFVPDTSGIAAVIAGREASLEKALKEFGEWVFAAGRVVTALLGGAERFPGEELLSRARIGSFMAAPLATTARPFGVLTLIRDAATAPDDDDLDFFARVSTQVSLAVANMLSYEQIAALKARLERENAYLTEEIKAEHNFEEMVGSSPAFRALTETIRRVAPTDATVLITGESGTGKELVARAVHSLSERKRQPLVKVNCAAISAGLVESELFGHVKGAFTGALERRIGRFEFAQGGTLFLDEVGELPLETQAKLLRVLQEHEFEPVGSNRTVHTDVRIIAATNRQLEQSVRDGRFRADLYFRLSVFPVVLPPLRDRRSDIPDLVSFILENYNRQFGRVIKSVSDDTMRRLKSYDWPGNIRELQNVLARAVVLSPGPVLRLGDEFFPIPAGEAEFPADSGQSLNDVEKTHIVRVLEESRWVIEGARGAARILNLHPNTLRSRMKKLQISRPVNFR